MQLHPISYNYQPDVASLFSTYRLEGIRGKSLSRKCFKVQVLPLIFEKIHYSRTERHLRV